MTMTSHQWDLFELAVVLDRAAQAHAEASATAPSESPVPPQIGADLERMLADVNELAAQAGGEQHGACGTELCCGSCPSAELSPSALPQIN